MMTALYSTAFLLSTQVRSPAYYHSLIRPLPCFSRQQKGELLLLLPRVAIEDPPLDIPETAMKKDKSKVTPFQTRVYDTIRCAGCAVWWPAHDFASTVEVVSCTQPEAFACVNLLYKRCWSHGIHGRYLYADHERNQGRVAANTVSHYSRNQYCLVLKAMHALFHEPCPRRS